MRPSGIECDQQIDVDNCLSTDLKSVVFFFFLNSKHLSEDVSSSQLEGSLLVHTVERVVLYER